jgi:hypothetical protein
MDFVPCDARPGRIGATNRAGVPQIRQCRLGSLTKRGISPRLISRRINKFRSPRNTWHFGRRTALWHVWNETSRLKNPEK